MFNEYNPEIYWDNVARHIDSRNDLKIIAGDDEPYYRHKRKLFLKLFDQIDFNNKSVLEVGSGPGGNLAVLSGMNCEKITGVDISGKMIELSKKILAAGDITILKINGVDLPFPDKSFDISFTSTVLQHITNEVQLVALIKSICRVSKDEIIIFERIEKKIKGHQSNVGRPIEYYSSLFKENSFTLVEATFLKIQASYYTCGIIRKTFNRKQRKEGESISKISHFLETVTLPVTKLFDKIIPGRRDLGMLHFKRNR
jgi:ubiquinone/menaquinone biosynthesis C-methylase UbiE